MAQKFISKVNGKNKEVEGKVTSAGSGDAGKFFTPDSSGRWDMSLMPVGIGAEIKVIAASENLAAGDFVNMHVSSGLKVRKADATNPSKAADGFVLAAVTSGQNATVYFGNLNTSVTGLTAGDDIYLSNSTPGGVQNTEVTTSGHILQYLGKATSSTEISVRIDEATERA